MDNQFGDMRQGAWVFLIALATCAPVWIALAHRFLRGEPLLRYERRRPVPWRAVDVAVVFGPILVPLIMSFCLVVLPPLSGVSVENGGGGVDSNREVTDQQDDKPSVSPETGADNDVDQKQLEKAHPLIKLLHQHRDPWTILLLVLSAVVVVPIAEEFLFRLVLQGWLEAAERRFRRRRPGLLPLRPGVWPIVLASFLFGAAHVRSAAPPEEVDRAVLMFPLIVYPLYLALAVAWLRFHSGATAVDFGVVPSRFFSDCRTGILAFLAVAVPIYGLQVLLTVLLSNIPGFVADPITLFFFASTLGFLYGRTHRLVPAIVLHMALNASSVAMALMLA